MIDKTLSYLDYPKLLDILKHYSATPFIEESLSELTWLHDSNEINQRLDRVEAILELVKWDGKLPFYEVPDVRETFKRIALRDSVLEAKEFLLVSGFLRNCGDVAQFMKRAHEKKPYLLSLHHWK